MHHSAFGSDKFGQIAEKIARFFGTAGYIIGQTTLVLIWIVINALGFAFRWDPYPFILLNLAFSTQAAYAAPLILLAATRQADRDKIHEEVTTKHREQLSLAEKKLIEQNTEITEEIHQIVTLLKEEAGL